MGDDEDGALLPTHRKEDVSIFVRLVPEFVLWQKITAATVVATMMTMSRVFNVPVYTPILVVYTVGAGAYMFKKRFDHMRKHNYLPWTSKKKYGGGGGSS